MKHVESIARLIIHHEKKNKQKKTDIPLMNVCFLLSENAKRRWERGFIHISKALFFTHPATQ